MNYHIFDKEVNDSNKKFDITFPKISNNSRPLKKTHDNYMMDRNAELFYNQNQGNYMSPVDSRSVDSGSYKPVQSNFQTDYVMSNFETINNHQERNLYLDRNPVNSRRDQMEKSRIHDRKMFLDNQGGNLHNFVPMHYENTRKEKKEMDTSNYIPNAMTMPIPKENI